MKKSHAPILLHCPECKANFEFDNIGENEFVPCPICGTDFVTVKHGNRLMLQTFEQTQVYQEAVILA